MTSPLNSVTYPTSPTAPSSSPAGYVTPTTLSQGNKPPITGQAIEAYRGNFIELILREVVRALTGFFLPGAGQAFDQLVSWANGLFDMIREPLSQLVTLLVTILDSIPFIGPPVGNAVNDLAALFGLMKSRDSVQQASADTANVGLAILTARVNGIIAGGATFWDTFDRNVTDMATDPGYDVVYYNGPGSMNLSTADSGVARWAAVGFSDAGFIARDKTTPMTTNIVRVSAVISDFIYGGAGNQSHIRLMARMSADQQNYVVGTVEDGLAEIGYVVAGTYTRMGGQVSITTDSGDLWDLEVGTHGDVWQFRLLQNNALRVDRIDLGHVSQKDVALPPATYKWAAIGGDCAVGLGAFFTTYQIGMPDFQVLAAVDF